MQELVILSLNYSWELRSELYWVIELAGVSLQGSYFVVGTGEIESISHSQGRRKVDWLRGLDIKSNFVFSDLKGVWRSDSDLVVIFVSFGCRIKYFALLIDKCDLHTLYSFESWPENINQFKDDVWLAISENYCVLVMGLNNWVLFELLKASESDTVVMNSLTSKGFLEEIVSVLHILLSLDLS